MAEPCSSFSSLATSSPSPPYLPCTYLLLSLFGVAEPAGSTVARGMGVPGLGMVFEVERGEPSPCTGTGSALFTAQPLQMLEVLQESQDSPSCPAALGAPAGRPEGCRLLEGRHNMGLASRWGSAPRLSAAAPEETIPSLSSCSVLYLLIPCAKTPFVGSASSPAAARAALPCPTPAGSVVLQCSPADCPLPGSACCSFTCRNTQSSCPSEGTVQRRARCCY